MKRSFAKDTGALVLQFESMSEITDKYVLPEAAERVRTWDDYKFVGRELTSWEETQQAAHKAWSEGMDILLASVERLKKEEIPELKSKQRRTEFTDDEGDEFDYERFMAGEQAWRSSSREETHGCNEVTIFTDTSTPANRDHADILWRGAVAIALASLLEQKGYRVELWVVNGSYLFSGDHYGVCTACCLKKTSDPMDVSTLVNTVSGWFYRTATFALLETICIKENKRKQYGYGGVYSPRPADLDEISRDENRIYSAGAYSFNGAIQQVVAELNRFKPKGKTE